MIIENVMDEIGTQLDTISGLRVKPYEADEIAVPAALVSLPGLIDYQTTFGPGFCRFGIEITILVSKVDDRVRRKQIAPYGDTTGAKSIRYALESKASWNSFDSLEVQNGRFTVIGIADDAGGSNNYLGFVVLVDILART